jgi:hypothetical protein
MRAAILAMCLAAAVACGSSSNPDGGGTCNPAGQCPCTFTLSGATTDTGTCLATVARSTNNQTTLSILGQRPAGSSTSFSFASALGTADLAMQTYTQSNVTNSGATVSVDIPDGGGQKNIWNQFVHDTTNSDQGTFSLAISTPGTKLGNGTNTVWANPHGTLDATLPPSPFIATTTGTVTVHLTF